MQQATHRNGEINRTCPQIVSEPSLGLKLIVLLEEIIMVHYVKHSGVPLSETAPTITSVDPLNQTCVEVRLEGPENGRSCFNNYTVEATCDGGSVVEGSVGVSADSSVVVCPDRVCPNDPCTYTAYGQVPVVWNGTHK